MRRIVEYFTCWAFEDNGLDDFVNEKIREGFEPYGNPYYAPMHDEALVEAVREFGPPGTDCGYQPALLQAVVRYECD